MSHLLLRSHALVRDSPASTIPVGHEPSFTNVNGGPGTADWDAWLKFMDTYLKPANFCSEDQAGQKSFY